MAGFAEIGLDNVCQELERQICIMYLIFSEIWDVKCSMDVIWKSGHRYYSRKLIIKVQENTTMNWIFMTPQISYVGI